MGSLACFLWAQSHDELTPRQIFDNGMKAPTQNRPNPPRKTPAKTKPVDPPPVDHPVDTTTTSTHQTSDSGAHTMQAAYTPLAVRYSILQQKGSNFEEVDADSEFHSGDRIRVRVVASAPAYLYIVMGGSSGQWKVLFPDKDIDGGNNHIEKGQSYTIPPDGEDAFRFFGSAGVERVSLLLSPKVEPDLEKLIYEAGDPTRSDDHKTIMAGNRIIDGAVMGSVREKVLSRDLVFEKYNGPAPDGKSEKAVYATTKDKNPDARLWVDLKMVHK